MYKIARICGHKPFMGNRKGVSDFIGYTYKGVSSNATHSSGKQRVNDPININAFSENN